MIELEQHHVRYLEIHGEDEIIMLSHEEHRKVHSEDKANGFKSIPKWISNAAHARSPVGKARSAKYDQSEGRKAANARYDQSEKGRIAHARYHQSEKGKAACIRHAQSEKGKATQARADLKRRPRKEGEK